MSDAQTSDQTIGKRISFIPTSILHVKRAGGLSNQTEFKDISNPSSDIPCTLDDSFLTQAKEAAANITTPLYKTTSRNLFGGSYSLSTADGHELANVLVTKIRLGEPGKLVSFGNKKFTFPLGSPHSTHAFEMATKGIGKTDEFFVLENEVHCWETRSASERVLWRGEGNSKVMVAQYAAKRGWSREGVLAIDGERVDVVVAAFTCFALLTRSDSFN